MRKIAVLAALIGFGCLFVFDTPPPESHAQHQGNSADPSSASADSAVFANNALGVILAGAPEREIYSTDAAYKRVDFNMFTVPEVRTWGVIDVFTYGGWLYTTGGTDTSRATSTNNGITMAVNSSTRNIAFTSSGEDSTEGVVLSTPAFRPAAGTSVYMYAQFSMLDVDGANFLCGLSSSFNPYASPNHGSPWDHSPVDLWDGTLNESHDAVWFNIPLAHGAPLDSIYVIAISGALVETTFVDLTTDVPNDAGGTATTPATGLMELAFRWSNIDSLWYYANGDTGFVDVSGVFSTPDPQMSMMMAMQDQGGALNLTYLRSMWAAESPR